MTIGDIQGAPPPWEGQPYSIKRHGTTIDDCDSEPIQTPGCIQSHGALLVVRPSDFVILQVSENTAAVLGAPPQALLGRSLATVLGESAHEQLRTFVASEPIHQNPLHALTLPARGDSPPLDVTVHTVGGVVVVEIEASSRTEEPHADYYVLVRKVAARLQRMSTIQALCKAICAEVRAITGLDRVMVYKFHADHHGEVIAEHKRDDLPSWLGLHYPAEDIPRPVREVFKKIWARPVLDVDDPLAELVPLAHSETGEPVDLTYSSLRGTSVMYSEYLRNMKVKASLTLALRRDAELWGLVACHHGTRLERMPYQVRIAGEFVAQLASLQLQLVEEREQLAYRVRLESIHNQLATHAAEAGDLGTVVDGTPALLDGLVAEGAALCHRGEWWTVGITPTETERDALADWLVTRPEWNAPDRPLYATDSLSRDYPPAAAFADVASGVLAFPLSRAPRSLMMWFRPEQVQLVHWGGNPHDKPTVLGPHGPRLTPRASFELFLESVRQRSLPWSPVEMDAALRLRILLMELVISRAERLAELNAELARSSEAELDTFAYVASHDIKEPLRGIQAYAHELLENSAAVDEKHRRKLDALVRLTSRMDSLLDSLLHFSQLGRAEMQLEDVDLGEVLAEAAEMANVQRSVERIELVVPRPLPGAWCDRARVREVLVHLLANAIKYNDSNPKRIEVGFIAPEEEGPRPGCPVGSPRHVIYFVRDNGIGIAPKHHEHVFKMFRRLHGREQYGGGVGAGLTIAKRLVERHQGRIWLDSALGKGTTVFFTLPLVRGAA